MNVLNARSLAIRGFPRLKLVGVVVAVLAVAAGPSPDELANKIASEIMSPFCPGVTLHDCPSSAAVDLRARIERWARAGMTEAEILDRLESEYGPQIRSVPPAEGTGLLAWLLPGAALALGGVAAWLLVRRWARPASPVNVDDASPEDRSRLDAELARLREQL